MALRTGWPFRRCMGIPQARVSYGPPVRAGGIGWPVPGRLALYRRLGMPFPIVGC